jgi:PAS domain S-box-containing protein
MVEDVTARKQAEEERARLAMAVESAAEAVVITDTQGTIEYVNPAFVGITGYTREEAVGRNIRLLKSGKQDEAFYENLWDTIRRGDVWTGRFVNRKKDGRLYDEEETISPVLNTSGSIVNYVAIKRDVTRELELEQRLRQAQKMEAVGTLAGGIAHDFNNILQSVLGFCEVAQAELTEDSPVKHCVDEITVAGLRARDLVMQILAFSRQSGHRAQPMRLQHILKEVRGLLRGTIPSTIEIRCVIANECGPVLADPTRIHQIIMNLSTNAYHAMQEKGGVLDLNLDQVSLDEEQAALHSDLRPGSYARLTVSDTGSGMEPSVMERIFDPYFTTKARAQGSGLGLSVVMGIVKELGGSISVSSTVGQGSRFEVLLPLCEAKAEEAEGGRSGETEKAPLLKGSERILLVDDEESILRAMQAYLRAAGYEVRTCANGMEALELFCAAPDGYDIVVTDQTMPQLTGLQLAREIRRVRPNLPVILCTGYSETLDEDSAKEQGLRAFVTKPIMPRALAQAIRTALNGHSNTN